MLHLKKLSYLKNRLHILFINSWYPSKVLPVNGDFIQRHAEAVALKHKVTAIHIITDPNCKRSFKIEKKEINGINTIIGYIKQTQNPIIKGYLFLRAYKNILNEIGHIDHVHLNVLYPLGIFALHLKWFRKKPFIISEHWTDYQYPLSKNIKLKERYISKLITKNAAFVCPVSKHLQNAMQDFGLDGNYYPVPNVVDTNLFIPSSSKPSKFKILHISSMNDDQKNISGIIDVISLLQHKISDFKFTFIGSNSIKYKRKINELSINQDIITFIDHINQKELVNYLQEATVFVLFSNYENLPCVILESFSTGTPIISTNVGGISECFPQGFGTLIPAKNQERLLLELISFYNQKKQIESSEKMHKYVVNNFSKEKICDTFTKLYTKVLIEKE